MTETLWNQKRSSKSMVVRWAVIAPDGQCRGVHRFNGQAKKQKGIHDRIFKYVGPRLKSDGSHKRGTGN